MSWLLSYRPEIVVALPSTCADTAATFGQGKYVSICCRFLQAAAQQADTVMATEQGSEPPPSSSAPANEAPAPAASQDAQAAPAEETPESRAAALLEEDKRQRERKPAPAPKPVDMSTLLPG